MASSQSQSQRRRLLAFAPPLERGRITGAAAHRSQAMSMFAECGFECGQSAILVVAAIVWFVSGLATLLWLNVVFRRFETTQALPIEYGAVQVCAVCSGLIFFDEAATMDDWQLVMCIAGAIVILVGIAIGRLRDTSVAIETSSTLNAPHGFHSRSAAPTADGPVEMVCSPAAGLRCSSSSVAAPRTTASIGDAASKSGTVLCTTEADDGTPSPVRPRSEPSRSPSFTMTVPFVLSISPKLRDLSGDFSPLVPHSSEC